MKILNLFIILLLFSCSGTHPIIQDAVIIKGNNWNRFTVYQLQGEIVDTSLEYSINVLFSVTDAYKEDNIDFYLDVLSSKGESRYIERKVAIRDSVGQLLDTLIRTTVLANIKLASPGIYKFELGNLMTKFDNPGVSKLAIEVVENE